MSYRGEDRRAAASGAGNERKSAILPALVVTGLLIGTAVLFAASAEPQAEDDGALGGFFAASAASLVLVAAALSGVRWLLEGHTATLWKSASLSLIALTIAMVDAPREVVGDSGFVGALGAAGLLGALVVGTCAALAPEVDTAVRGRRVALTAAGVTLLALAACLLTGVELTPHASGDGSLALAVVAAIGWAVLASLFFARSAARHTHTFVWHGALAGAMAGHELGFAVTLGAERTLHEGHAAILVVAGALVLVGAIRDLHGAFLVQHAQLVASRSLAASAAARLAATRNGADQRAHSARNALCAIAGATQILERHHDRIPLETRASLVESVATEVAHLQELIAADLEEQAAAEPISPETARFGRRATDRSDAPALSPAVDR